MVGRKSQNIAVLSAHAPVIGPHAPVDRAVVIIGFNDRGSPGSHGRSGRPINGTLRGNEGITGARLAPRLICRGADSPAKANCLPESGRKHEARDHQPQSTLNEVWTDHEQQARDELWYAFLLFAVHKEDDAHSAHETARHPGEVDLIAIRHSIFGSSHKCVHDSAPSRSATPWKEAADVLVPANQR